MAKGECVKLKDNEFPDTVLWKDEEVTKMVNAFRTSFPKQTRRGRLS